MSTSPDEETDLSSLQEAVAGVWSIERELGRGGMATVYLARDVALDRPVALKVLHSSLASQPDQRERFLREARTGAKLSHPNIAAIYAVEETESFVYFVMALVDGETLGERIRREGIIRPEDAEPILREIAWALGYAHAMGLVHRDVTLDNILIERASGRAILADFGIASEIERVGEGPLLGSPAYLAPEVIQGGLASERSDLYSLGVVAWTMLAGRNPFLGEDSSEILLKHIREDAPSLVRAAPGTPSRLVRAAERLLLKDPTERPSSAEAWLALLDEESKSVSIAAPLRKWLVSWGNAKPFYALGMMYLALIIAEKGLLSVLILGFRDSIDRYIIMLAQKAMIILPFALALHFYFELRELRQLARAGYGVADLQLALAAQRSEKLHAGKIRAHTLGRLVRYLRWLSLAVYLFIGSRLIGPPSAFQYLLFRWAERIFFTSISFNMLVPSRVPKPDGMIARARKIFWNSALGSRMLKLASIGLPAGHLTEQTLHRPTELVLDLAIEDLWNALPGPMQQQTVAVPRIAESLRRRVSQVKDLQKLLVRSALPLTAETSDLRERLAEQHLAGVSALERLRILMGKLGGSARIDSEFTIALAGAQNLEKELLAELGAHEKLVKALKKTRSTPLTPEFTPAPA